MQMPASTVRSYYLCCVANFLKPADVHKVRKEADDAAVIYTYVLVNCKCIQDLNWISVFSCNIAG